MQVLVTSPDSDWHLHDRDSHTKLTPTIIVTSLVSRLIYRVTKLCHLYFKKALSKGYNIAKNV